MTLEDPIPEVFDKLLDLWRSGENKGLTDRKICHNVMGICDSGRPSTLSVFKPGVPIFYGLLKIHKLDSSDLKPGKQIPLRLINDLSQSPTARSDKHFNWKYLKPLQDEFCFDLVKDSTETLKWLEGVASSRDSGLSGFTWNFSSLYDNLTPELVLEALIFAISELRPEWSASFVDWLLKLVNLSLKSCFGRHGNDWYMKLLLGDHFKFL